MKPSHTFDEETRSKLSHQNRLNISNSIVMPNQGRLSNMTNMQQMQPQPQKSEQLFDMLGNRLHARKQDPTFMSKKYASNDRELLPSTGGQIINQNITINYFNG